ncbi:uncharacterized protein SCHCODRAFT_02512091 [Schizophyllum commune H4-8]|nr:uncharacterized protein SCHCODRAFT_02512091 [Schizophyllum commune H4-8]KAI5888144.1 hypothetical protein SCHCODRAFT_02512091 [Schizophyllum commune H4-8]
MENPTLAIYIRIWHDHLVNAMLLALFYGIHFALYVAAVSAISRRNNVGRYFVGGMTTLLFATSTVWFTVNTRVEVLSALAPFRTNAITDLLRHIAAPLLVLARINHISSDIIVVWRAWVLWPDSKAVRLSLTLAILGTIAGSVVDFAYSYSRYGVAAYSWNLPDRSANYLRAFTSIVPVLLTNVLVTALVGVKVWTYRRSIKPALGRASQTRVEKIMVLLVESGGVYSCIWLAYLVITLADVAGIFHSNLTYMGPAGMLGTLMPAIAGVYPTLVVLLSTTQSSPTLYVSTNLVSDVSGPNGASGAGVSLSKNGISLARQNSTYEVPLHSTSLSMK